MYFARFVAAVPHGPNPAARPTPCSPGTTRTAATCPGGLPRPEPYRGWAVPRPGQRGDACSRLRSPRVLPYFAWPVHRRPPHGASALAAERRPSSSSGCDSTLWQGLGYYRRARNLHAAARVHRRPGMPVEVPATVAELLQLLARASGRFLYTAGAVASDRLDNVPAPILDGNVARRPSPATASASGTRRNRVLCPRHPHAEAPLGRGADLVERSGDPCDFNQSLMELGALISPQKSHAARREMPPSTARSATGATPSPGPPDRRSRHPAGQVAEPRIEADFGR